MKPILAVLFGIGLAASLQAQTAPPAASAVDDLAVKVAGAEGTVEQKTVRLVKWINSEFDWTATDYQQRTPEQIIERRGGNCAELARVLARLLDAVHIRYRFVREINVQPESESRQANAARKIETGGNRYSVFGRRHNDHTWLEVFDPQPGRWIPADPAVGVVGVDGWISARLAFADRRQPLVAATVPIVAAMLVPIAVVAPDAREDRSAFYLIDGFDAAYGGRLRELASWKEWTDIVHEFGRLAARAFVGEVNLHEHEATIRRAELTYETLRAQAKQAGLQLGGTQD